MNLELQNKRAIVMASSKGLGRAVATELAREGSSVVISSRSRDNLSDAKSKIVSNDDVDESDVIPVVCDLSEPEQIPSSIETAIDRLGGLDILVTNHGGPPSKSFDETSINEFDQIYETALRSIILVIKSALPHLRDGGGSITNIVSASAQEAPKNHILSNTFRSSIYGFSKGLSKEYGPDGIRVNCAAPRGIQTERLDYKIDVLSDEDNITVEEARERRTEELPLDRLGAPSEFGKAVAFIASDAASFTTGSVFEVDGGWTRHTM